MRIDGFDQILTKSASLTKDVARQVVAERSRSRSQAQARVEGHAEG